MPIASCADEERFLDSPGSLGMTEGVRTNVARNSRKQGRRSGCFAPVGANGIGKGQTQASLGLVKGKNEGYSKQQ